jgi:predicted RNA-binding Zn-ribbon protein involved in translation (DUF1610 family)
MTKLKKLLKNKVFNANLFPALLITILFVFGEKDMLSYIVGIIGVLNWFVVAVMVFKVLSTKECPKCKGELVYEETIETSENNELIRVYRCKNCGVRTF